MARLTKSKLTGTDLSKLINQKNPELREILRGARQLFDKQEKIFKSREDSVYSFAYEKMKDFYEDNGKKAVSRMKRSDMQKEVARLQDFFKSDTSTLPGTYKVMREQDARIFGTDESGKPLKRMTLEQRTNFWASYNEFVNMNSEAYIRDMTSNKIQQYLGDMIIDMAKHHDGDFMFTAGDFNHLKTILQEQKDLERWEMNEYGYGSDDILSGKRPY